MRWGDIIKKICNICEGCVAFNIVNEGGQVYYDCLNGNRWYDLFYTEEDFEKKYNLYGDALLIAVARYNSQGELEKVDVVDDDFDFEECEFKIEKRGDE